MPRAYHRPVDPLASTTQAHRERLIAHVDNLARLAGMIDAGITAGFIEECEAEHRFMFEQLLPHMQVIETTLYRELDRLLAGRHSMDPMRREHAELRRLVESAGEFHDKVTSGLIGPTEAVGLRRALYRLHAMLRVHLAEEELYERVLAQGLSDEVKAELARGIEQAAAEPM